MSSPVSREAKRAFWRDQYAKYRDKKLGWIKEKRKRKTREQLDREAAYQRQWRARNVEHLKKRRKAYYDKDPEKVRESRRRRYHRDRAVILERMKEKRLEKLKRTTTPLTRYVRIAPRPPPGPIQREPPTTTLFELVQDLFPNIIQVFL